MKDKFKKIGLIILIIIAIVILFLLYSFVFHKIVSSNDSKYLKKYDTGKIIEIDGQKVNYKIFNEEVKDNTILFLSGSGVTDSTLSMEPLANKLNARIIIINRPGYGSSEDTNTKAKIDYIINYYRKTLKELKISGKVILMPHSISGMYAMYWASLYPDEIKSIIGLDIGSPYLYLEDEPDKSLNLMYISSILGLHRQTWLLNLIGYKTAIINYDTYDKEYFKAIEAMNNIKPFSKFNLSEEKNIKENAITTINNINDEYHSIKKIFIVANSIEGDFYEKYIYKDILSYYKDEEKLNTYKKNVMEYQNIEEESLTTDNNTEFIKIEGPHCLYYYPSEKLIKTINEFIK